jgi:hypothetical protein
MKTILHVVSIRATKEQVWNLLAAPDGFLAFPAGSEGISMPPLAANETMPFKKMVWRRNLLLGAVWTWTAQVRPAGLGFVEFEIRETRTGWFANFSSRDESDAQRNLHHFAVNLKRFAEAEAAAQAKPEAAAQPVQESLFLLAANQPAISEYSVPRSHVASHSQETNTDASPAPTPATRAFTALLSSTNDGLLALLAAVPAENRDVEMGASAGDKTAQSGAASNILERPKCRNGHARARRISHARSL